MNTFFKKLIVVSMVFALVLSLTACGVNINSVGLPTELTLDKGAAQLLAVEFGTEDEATEEKIAEAASKLTLVWTSSDEAVVTVDADTGRHGQTRDTGTVLLSETRGRTFQIGVSPFCMHQIPCAKNTPPGRRWYGGGPAGRFVVLLLTPPDLFSS